MRSPLFTDAEIRPALRSHIKALHSGEEDTVLLEELGVGRGRVRADLALVNSVLHCYEIKSDRDGLRRLQGQVSVYGQVFDRATLVVGSRHLTDAMAMLPEWWEVIRIASTGNRPRFEVVRQGQHNQQRDPRVLVEFLWRDHALALLAHRHAARGLRRMPRPALWQHVCECYDVDEIAAAVRAKLKARLRMPTRPSRR